MVAMANTCMPIYVELCSVPRIAPMIGRPVRVLLDISTMQRKGREDLRDRDYTLISTDLSPQSLYAARLCATRHHDANKGTTKKSISHSKNDEARI